jgi:putative tryptophan/tyrosine transport system substrate-binding protein
MKRREFIAAVGIAAAWPVVARAQERMRRIGVLTGALETDPEIQARYSAFKQALQQLGWTEGTNLRIDYRWGSTGDSELVRRHAAELLALGPDLFFPAGSTNVGALQQATRTVPIVFVNVVDPVGAGFVAGLARPGGNITGFTSFEYGMSAKWLELLKQIAPNVTRVAVLRDTNQAGIGLLAAMQGVAPSLGIELSPVGVRDADQIARGIIAFAGGSNGGLIVTQSGFTITHRDLISKLATQHRLPAVYNSRAFVVSGGLISYGVDYVDQFRRAARYVDRILKGEKTADLPVQAPTNYELVINLKTAKALGLDVPQSLLARADEVIE